MLGMHVCTVSGQGRDVTAPTWWQRAEGSRWPGVQRHAVVPQQGVAATLGSLLSAREAAWQHARVLQGRYAWLRLDCIPKGWLAPFCLVGYVRTQLCQSLSQAVLELPESWRSGCNESS